MSDPSADAPERLHHRLSREEINAYPLIRYEGPVRLVTTAEEADLASAALGAETVLGFDTETRPSYRKGIDHPPALLQLAGSETVYLFQLKKTGLPRPLRRILADPATIKTGVAIKDDIRNLQRLSPFRAAGMAELMEMAKKAGLKNHGLRGLATILLGGRISKTSQRSDWSRTELTTAQIRYAATDAWIGREIYLALAKLLAGPRA